MSEEKELSKELTARSLARSVGHGVLCTLSKEMNGYPFGSVAPYVMDLQGAPHFLVSDLAQHTINFLEDPRVSLFISEPGPDGDAQRGPRVTIMGEVEKLDPDKSESISSRYFNFFPTHRDYFLAHNFFFFKLNPQRVRFIQGFGRIHWIEKEKWALPTGEWEEVRDSIVNHMNEDHKDAVLRIAKGKLQGNFEEASLLEIDGEGFHVMVDGKIHYILFDSSCYSTDDFRKEFIKLSKEFT